MPLTLVQSQSFGTSVGATSMSATFGATPTQNNLLICAANSDSDITMTSTGWSVAVSDVFASALYIYYKLAGASESSTVTIGINVSDSGEMGIYEYTGNTLTPLDQTAHAHASGVSSQSTGTTATTAQADELLFAAVGKDSTTGWTSPAWTNSFVTITGPLAGSGVPGATVMLVATRAVVATGAYTTTASWADGNWSAEGAIATFRGVPIPRNAEYLQAVNRADTY